MVVNEKEVFGTHVNPNARTASTVLSSDYIGNSNTGNKFHYAICRCAQKMNEEHKVYFDTRKDVVDAGYVPYKVFRP